MEDVIIKKEELSKDCKKIERRRRIDYDCNNFCNDIDIKDRAKSTKLYKFIVFCFFNINRWLHKLDINRFDVIIDETLAELNYLFCKINFVTFLYDLICIFLNVRVFRKKIIALRY